MSLDVNFLKTILIVICVKIASTNNDNWQVGSG